ncbi:MAG: hypothetical protein L3J24_13855 [Xanthomonadales bacterium]|nr:hypothetical protein [Xanthomonadales bacterium]
MMNIALSLTGIFHTIFGIAALISGFLLLWKNKQISYGPFAGKIYLITTIITAASSLAIFKHGTFHVAHLLGVFTLLAVLVGVVTEKMIIFKSWNKYAVNLFYSSTILFHLLPTATEILTRFPPDSPIANSLKDPLLLKTFVGIFLVFLIMLIWQMKWLKGQK